MKIRDSGMPDEAYWESLLDVPLILTSGIVGAGVASALGGAAGLWVCFRSPSGLRVAEVLPTRTDFDRLLEAVRSGLGGWPGAWRQAPPERSLP